MRRALSLLVAVAAIGLIVLGVYTFSVADRSEYENAENYAFVVLIGGLVLVAVAWVLYPRGSR